MNRLVALVQLIGTNAVPLWALGQGWSPATVLIVYWSENLLSGLLIAARIGIHRRLTRRKGHYLVETVERGSKRFVRGSFLANFSVIALAFTAAHGVFLGAMLAILLTNRRIAWTETPEQIATALLVTSATLVFAFLLDLTIIRQQPFAWIRSLRNRAFGRTFVVHLGIVFGTLVAVFAGVEMMFIVFVILKTLFDALLLLPWSDPLGDPPRWLADAMARQAAGGSLEEHEVYWIERWRIDSAGARESEEVQS